MSEPLFIQDLRNGREVRVYDAHLNLVSSTSARSVADYIDYLQEQIRDQK